MTVIVLTFGAALIALIYVISTAFSDSVTAGKCIAPILILLGNIAPAVVLPLILSIAGEYDGAFTAIIGGFVYLTNPFATFFVGCYTVSVNYWA